MTLQQATTQLKAATSDLKQYNKTVQETGLHDTAKRLYLTTKVKELIWVVSQKIEQTETEIQEIKSELIQQSQYHIKSNTNEII